MIPRRPSEQALPCMYKCCLYVYGLCVGACLCSTGAGDQFRPQALAHRTSATHCQSFFPQRCSGAMGSPDCPAEVEAGLHMSTVGVGEASLGYSVCPRVLACLCVLCRAGGCQLHARRPVAALMQGLITVPPIPPHGGPGASSGVQRRPAAATPLHPPRPASRCCLAGPMQTTPSQRSLDSPIAWQIGGGRRDTPVRPLAATDLLPNCMAS